MYTYTKDQIKIQLQKSQKWLEKAVVAIYKKQTALEQNREKTLEHNGIGFNGPDSRVLSYYARWIMSGNNLSGKHLCLAQKKMLKYSGQLTKIANGEM